MSISLYIPKDLSWWFRDKIQSLNYTTWNMPRVSVVQPNSTDLPGNTLPPDTVIQLGDMLHVDFGLTALGLNTDTQHLGFVGNSSSIPNGFLDGLKKGNRM